ncbi:MAG: DUF4336 domain-containing protein [Thermosynechococcaceae cyanobacterium]
MGSGNQAGIHSAPEAPWGKRQDRFWPLWPLVPIYPYSKRRTLRKEIVKDQIWTFEQLQGILYVIVPVRMTVIKLQGRGLFVYAPVAPTQECLRLMQELIDQHGPVQYIIMPTASGIEHKAFAGPFARQFPSAQVFVVPGQWSFPIKLPLSWLGLPGGRTQILPTDSAETPFADQFDYKILGPVELGPGPFAEVAFLHKPTQTLLVTDVVVSVPEQPPQILEQEPYPMLYHAKDDASEVVEDTPATRRKGWQRIALFAFFFRPSALEVTGWGQSFRDAWHAPDRSSKAYFGLFPVRWRPDWKDSFDTLRGDGRLFVAPILQRLVLNRGSQLVIDWANQVAAWSFQTIIPCHLDAPVQTTPQAFRQAFGFLEQQPNQEEWGYRNLPEEEFEFLNRFDQVLIKRRITPPPQEKV